MTRSTKSLLCPLDFERLEERRFLAFSGNFVEGLLQIGQRVDDGDVLVSKIGDRISVTDGSGTSTFDTQSRHQVYLLSDSSPNITLEFDSTIAGDFTLDVKNGQRNVVFRQAGAATDATLTEGPLRILGRNGDQNITFEGSSARTLGFGGLEMDLGEGNDQVEMVGNWKLSGPIFYQNVENVFANGNLTIDQSATTTPNTFIAFRMQGDLTYLGGSASDTVILPVGETINGKVDIRTGDGDDTVELRSGMSGVQHRIFTGDGVDQIIVNPTGVGANLNIQAGMGNDI